MKNHWYTKTALVFALYSIAFNSARAVDTPPTAAVAARTATDLWKAKKLAEFERFVRSLMSRHPKRPCSLVGGAFVDLFMHGDVDKARIKLEEIHAAIEAGAITATAEFESALIQQLFIVTNFDVVLEWQGKTKADLKGNADVIKAREFFGSKVPELLEMMALAPDAGIP